MPLRLAESADSAYAYPLLLRQLLHTPLVTAADQVIGYRDRFRYTYRDFHARLARLASALAALGAGPGTTVAVMDWDSHRYLECYFAVPMMGAVLQTVNVRLSPEQVQYTLDHAAAEVVLVHDDFVPLLAAIRPQLPKVRAVIRLDDGGPAVANFGFDGSYEQLLAEATAPFTFTDFDENAVATTFYTTGTTGAPKAVSFSHRQLVLHTIASAASLGTLPPAQGIRLGDVYMPITPMFHVHAWGLPYVATLLGLKQIYPGRYDPDLLLALKRTEGVTFSHGVPTILQMLLNARTSAETDLRGWKMIIGGSAFPTGLAKAAVARGMEVFAAYGMSETCPFLTVSRPTGAAGSAADRVEERCRTGQPSPLVDLRVVDPDMADVARDGEATGEIVARAPWLTQAYRGNAAASAELWRGGYLHTQDVATIDAHGTVQIRDRLKDVIKTGGEWISSLQLEDLISRLDDVAEVAVVGVPDARWGERPLVLIVARPSAAIDADKVRRHLQPFVERGQISRFALPERVLCVAALDKTSVGKLNKKLMREKYAGQ